MAVGQRGSSKGADLNARRSRSTRAGRGTNPSSLDGHDSTTLFFAFACALSPVNSLAYSVLPKLLKAGRCRVVPLRA